MRSLLRALCVLAITIVVAPAHAGDRAKVKVVIEPTAHGASVAFTFDRPVASFRLSYPADDIYDRTWRITTPNVKREGTLVTRTDNEPVAAFAVEIQVLNEPTDTLYPCLFRVGADGLAFYAGYFAGIEEDFDTTIEVVPPKDHMVAGFPRGANSWRVDPGFHRNTGHRYVYVGPRTNLHETSHASFVISPGTPPAVVERIRENVHGAIGFYTRELARPLPAKPLIIVADNFDHERAGAQGDITSGPTVALRLFSKRWRDFDPTWDRLDHLIAHEVAHFWNSGTFHATKDAPAWVWEGAAEFWALAARVAVMKRLTPQGRRQHIERALNTCATSLFDQSLTGSRSSATYTCGETFYWIADAAEKRRSRGRNDIFSIWRRIFEKADRNGGVYSVPDLLTAAVASDDSSKALTLFVSGGTDRWKALPDALKPLGVRLATEPTPPDTLRRIAMWHILNMACTGSRGMWHEANYLKLDTGDRCGPISGDPEVDTLNDHNLYSDMPSAYATAQAACAAHKDLILTRSGKPEKWTVPCTKPLADAPPQFRVIQTP